jgi:hypothetical protein
MPKPGEYPLIFPNNREFAVETGSPRTVHTTIQSPQAAGFRDDAKLSVSGGISGDLFSEFLSLRERGRFTGEFWRPVSASK